MMQRARARLWGRPRGRSDNGAKSRPYRRAPLREDARVGATPFDAGEEPDLVLAETAPEQSELYLPGRYERRHLGAMLSAKPWTAQWDDTSEATKLNESRSLQLSAPGLPLGAEVTWKVYQLIDGDDEALTATLTTPSVPEGANTSFDDWYNPDLVRPDCDVLPTVSFRFTVECGGRRVSADVLRYEDKLHIEFLHDGSRGPGDSVEYRIFGPWGSTQGTAASDGVVDVDGIPPGGVRVIAPEHRVWFDE